MLEAKSARESEVSASTVVMPQDTNGYGNLFGGSLVAHIDRMAAISALKHCRTNVVTAAIERLDFLAPAHLNDFLHFNSRVTFTSKHSMELRVVVEAEHPFDGDRRRVCQAFLTFVALRKDGSPAEVPSLLLENDEDRRMFAEGRARYQVRKAERKMSGS